MAFDTIKLEKGLYTTGKSFTKALETLDPSENYRGTELEGLDAYQRQLKRFDIKVSGKDSDTVAKFFQTSDSAALFPEYVARAVRQGMETENPLDKIVATTSVIDSLDYRAICTKTDNDSLTPSSIAEGAHIPETTIQLKETLTPLHKRGRMLVASYEAIKFQKLDLFTIMLAKIGSAIAKAQLEDAIDAIFSDANVAELNKTDSGNTVTYNDLLTLWEQFGPYKLTTLICNGAEMKQILALSEFKDAAAGQNFHGTGNLVTPFGAEMIKLVGPSLNTRIIGLDKSCALEKVQAGDVVTDFDKLIDRQLERAAITAIAGFSVMTSDAAFLMKTRAS